MKKLKFLLLFLSLLFLFSCDDNNYIDTVKSISTNEEIVINNYSCQTIDDITVALFKAAYPNDDLNSIRNSSKWEIEGDLSNGKMIKVSYKKADVFIPAYKEGDYVQVFPIEIKLKSNNKTFSLIDFINWNWNFDFDFE